MNLTVEQQRDKLLEILKTIQPAIHQLAWIGLVYNDHNFDSASVARKCRQAMKDSGLGSQFEGVSKYNEWLESIDTLISEIGASK